MKTVISVFVLTLALLFSGASAVAAETTDLAGVWQVSGFTKAYGNMDFLVDIRGAGPNRWEAYKINGSRYVPSGRMHFRGQVSGDSLRASVQIAYPRFADPEWKNHSFNLQRSDSGVVTSMALATGESHILDDTGDRTFNDRWTYTPWPADRFLLTAPRITQYGYGAAKSSARSQLRSAEDDIKRWTEALTKNNLKLVTERTTEATARGRVDGLKIVYEKAWEAVSAAKSNAPAAEPDRSGLPSRLRVLYANRKAAVDEIARAERIILANTDGTTAQSADTIAQLFKNIDRAKARISRLDAVIRRVREELGVPPDPDPNTGRDAKRATAEQTFKTAGDQYYGARGALSKAETATYLTEGQVELDLKEIAKGKKKANTARERLKQLDRENSLKKVEGYVLGGEKDTLIFEAIPSGLDVELRNLKTVLDEVSQHLGRAQTISAETKEAFVAAFNRGTVDRNRMADLIMENAYEMALLQGAVKTTEIAVAFGTGGPVGLAVELVTTPLFQFALYENGVVFENFDEKKLQGQYRAALKTATKSDPDPEEACRGLNIQISESVKGLLKSQKASIVSSYLTSVRRHGNLDVNADLANTAQLGNPSQRLNPNLLNYTAVGLSGLMNEKIAAATERTLVKNIAEATGEFESRVAQRASQALIDRVAALDAKMVDPALDAAARASALRARTTALRRFAARNPDMAQEITRNIDNVAKQMDRLEKVLRLGANNPTGEAAAAANVANGLRGRIRESQGGLRRALGSSIPEINVEASLAVHKALWTRLGKELERIDRLKSSFTKAGLRGTMKGQAVNIALSLVFAVGLEANVQRLQKQELALWQKIFAAEAEQSMTFRLMQRTRCIEWALLDQRDFLRRAYTLLYDAYDPEAELQVLRSEPVSSHQSLKVALVYEPTTTHRLKTKVGGIACPQSTRNACQIPAGGLKSASGPYLPVDIDLSPPE